MRKAQGGVEGGVKKRGSDQLCWTIAADTKQTRLCLEMLPTRSESDI